MNRQTTQIVQEAVCSGDENILTAILEVRVLQRHVQRVTHVPKLVRHLLDAPDFYIEMKWEFTSWGERFKMRDLRASFNNNNNNSTGTCEVITSAENFIIYYTI
uniref:Uncharacterized protein n=1 Tax=Glossina palpalis gambiensis TaxID=67801 RepID=A0A1B0BLC5_9MUSC